MSDEKEHTGWILEGDKPKQIQYVTGFASEDGFPYAREKGTFKSVMGRVHSSKEELIAAVEKGFQEQLRQKRAEASNIRRQMKRVLANAD